MCLTTSQLIPKISERDLEVFKLFREASNNNLYSPHTFSKYTLKELKEEEGFKVIYRYGKKTIHYLDAPLAIVISEGLHAFTTLEEAQERNFSKYISIFKCIIPAGTPYFKNNTKEIVTLKLIPLEKINI